MSPEEIRPGATYEGADGSVRLVDEIQTNTHRFAFRTETHRWVLWIPLRANFPVRRNDTMEVFASWAQREVRGEF